MATPATEVREPGRASSSTVPSKGPGPFDGTGTTSGWIVKIVLLGLADAIALVGLLIAFDKEAWGYFGVLLVTLVSVIGSLLAFDQFYIMTAGQPQNETATSVFYVYLNSFPYLKLGYGAALSMVLAVTILAFTVVQLLLTRRSSA